MLSYLALGDGGTIWRVAIRRTQEEIGVNPAENHFLCVGQFEDGEKPPIWASSFS